MSSWTPLCGILEQVPVPVKGNCNAKAYKYILYNGVTPTVWRRPAFGCDSQVSTNLWSYREHSFDMWRTISQISQNPQCINAKQHVISALTLSGNLQCPLLCIYFLCSETLNFILFYFLPPSGHIQVMCKVWCRTLIGLPTPDALVCLQLRGHRSIYPA